MWGKVNSRTRARDDNECIANYPPLHLLTFFHPSLPMMANSVTQPPALLTPFPLTFSSLLLLTSFSSISLPTSSTLLWQLVIFLTATGNPLKKPTVNPCAVKNYRPASVYLHQNKTPTCLVSRLATYLTLPSLSSQRNSRLLEPPPPLSSPCWTFQQHLTPWTTRSSILWELGASGSAPVHRVLMWRHCTSWKCWAKIESWIESASQQQRQEQKGEKVKSDIRQNWTSWWVLNSVKGRAEHDSFPQSQSVFPLLASLQQEICTVCMPFPVQIPNGKNKNSSLKHHFFFFWWHSGVNKCRCRCLMRCCSTLKRNILEHRVFLSTQGTCNTWWLQWRGDCCTITSVAFWWNCQLQHLQESVETWLADREVNSSPRPHMVVCITIHCPERRERGKRTSTFTLYHHQTCKCAAMCELTYCRKPCLKELHCTTQSKSLWWHTDLQSERHLQTEAHSFICISV